MLRGLFSCSRPPFLALCRAPQLVQRAPNADGTEPAGNNLELIVLARLAPEIDLREHEYEASESASLWAVQAAQLLLADGIGFRRKEVFLRAEVFLLAHAANQLHFCGATASVRLRSSRRERSCAASWVR